MASRWTWYPIGAVASVFDGPHATPTKMESGPIFLGISCLTSGRLDLTSVEHISEEDFKRWTRRVEPHTGDVVFSYETRIGQAALIPEGLRCCLGRRMGLVRVDPTKLDPSFFLYYYLGDEFQEFLRSRTVHGSTVDRIPLVDFPGFKVPVPPLREQRSLVSVLTALDDKIDLLQGKNRTLKSLAETIFKSWFVNFDPVHAKADGRDPEGVSADVAELFPSEFENCELGLMPKGWRVGTLADIFEIQGGTQPPASEFIEESREGYTRLLQIRDFSTDTHKTYIPWRKNLRTVMEDDVLIGRYGSGSGDAKKDSLGRLLRGLSGAINVAVVKTNPNIPNSREYISALVGSGMFYRFVVGGSARAVQAGFRQEDLAFHKVIIPPDWMFEAYESLASSLWQRRKMIAREIETISQIRDLLLPRLMSGRIQLQDAEESTA